MSADVGAFFEIENMVRSSVRGRWVGAMRGICPLLMFGLHWLPANAAAQSPEQRYRDECDAGDRTACAAFARLLEVGDGVGQDERRALDLYARACDPEHVDACTRLGQMYESGRGAPIDVRRARSYYWIACDAGNQLGCDLIASTAASHSELVGSLFNKRVHVVDAATSDGLAEALIELTDLGIQMATDSDGEVTLHDLPRGRHAVRVDRLGYQPLEGLLEVPGDDETLAPLSRSTAGEPSAPGRIRGRVTDERGTALDLVEVAVVGPNGPQVVTDASGAFRFEDVRPGLIELRFTRLGYAPRWVTLVLHADGAAEVSATLATQAVELEPIDVAVEARSDFLERQGFYERARSNVGWTLTREDLWERAPTRISDLMLTLSGIRIRRSLQQNSVARAYNPRRSLTSGEECWLEVYVDGVKSDPNIEQLMPSELEGIEAYTGVDIPERFRGLNPCGVVLMWRRR